MLNFFSSEDVTVPNGYVYTSHTGAKYVFLEGIWVNDSNMMLVEPSKYSNMYMCARAQIIEHNNSPLNKNKIGEKYIKENVECIYIGDNKFNSEKGIILENEQLTELMADDQRVYDVSKETLQKEWQALKFYILPPYNEDVSIPAGMVIQGYKYIPRAQRFVDLKTGEAVDPATTRRLTEVGIRMAREEANTNKLIPLKSVLVQGDTRSEWNGSEFCDNAGNVVVPKHQVSSIFNAYKEFVEANPQDFPTLINNSNKEQRFGSVDKPQEVPQYNRYSKPEEKQTMSEAEGDSNKVPNGIRITSGKGKTYQKQDGQWFDVETKKALNSSAAKIVEQAAERKIEIHNSDPSNIKIGSTVTSKSGKTYTYVGHDRFLSDDGKLMPKSAAQTIIDRHKQENSSGQGDTQPEPESQPQDQSQNNPEPKPQDAPKSDGDNSLESLASKIKASPFAPKIKVLLTRGDKVSLMAADILLSGQRDDAVQILKSLNNNDE